MSHYLYFWWHKVLLRVPIVSEWMQVHCKVVLSFAGVAHSFQLLQHFPITFCNCLLLLIIRGEGGRTRANSVCFTKYVVKIGAFPNTAPKSKIWKNLSVDQKDQRRRSVWVGHADFSKIAQRKQKFIKHVNCMFT